MKIDQENKVTMPNYTGVDVADFKTLLLKLGVPENHIYLTKVKNTIISQPGEVQNVTPFPGLSFDRRNEKIYVNYTEEITATSPSSAVNIDIPSSDFGIWAGLYNFYYKKSGDHQSTLLIANSGDVSQVQDGTDGRDFSGKATLTKLNPEANELTYAITSLSPDKMPSTKQAHCAVKIHVVWDNGGGSQDYYGYLTAFGKYVLTDGVPEQNGVQEVWIQN